MEATLGLEFADKAGVQSLALGPQNRERGLPLELARWRQHPSAGRTRFTAQSARIRYPDAHACLRESPGNAYADNSCADDDDIRTIPSHTPL